MRALPITNLCHDTAANNYAPACNTPNSGDNALLPASLRQGAEPCDAADKFKPSLVAGPILTGGDIDFLTFLTDPTTASYCELLLGGRATSAAIMLREFRQATEFHYFGHRRAKPGRKPPRNPGMLMVSATATKKLLKKYAQLAYRDDPQRRGVAYWECVAWLVWNCYAALMALRHRAETIRQQEQKRMASLSAKRAERTAYMRDYRTQQRAKAARYFKPEAKEAWRQQRSTAAKEKYNEH